MQPTAALRRLPLPAILVWAACAWTATGLGAKPVAPFGFEQVSAQAQRLAAAPYRADTPSLPKALKALNYDQYRDIRFKPERAQWRAEGLPYELAFFHLGSFRDQPVRVHEVGPQGVVKLRYRAEDHDFGRNRLDPKDWGDLGHAGFRVHHALNQPGYKDELVVFLGGSYWRALGRQQHYGLSARGLALDTGGGLNGQAEEFPRFTSFWVHRPESGATALRIHALLESPRATGAYEFRIQPGENTVTEVRARLFLREGIKTVGIAPLTSMFQHGENQPRAGDFRPEVHDSDGLMVATGEGEWLWRPLINPARPLTTSFATRSPKGFGLMQRDRDFGHYEDVEAAYEKRPSAWVEPVGDWGPGRVELYQWPTADEASDNIVAYWVPATLPPAGQPLEFRYRLHWQGAQATQPPNGWTVQSRTGRGFASPAPHETQHLIDFDGPALAALSADAKPEAVVSASSHARITESHVYRVPATGAWRLSLRVQSTQPQQPVELRAFLQHATHTLTETWTSIIQPE